MVGTLKPSPNEAEQMMHDEAQRRRKLRILQVREQEKMVSIRIRRAMKEKHDEEIENLSDILRRKWNKEHQAALKRSEEKFASCLKDVGSAHQEAEENAPNQALLNAIAEENRKAASERGISAVEHQRQIKRMEEEESIEKRRKRHVALIKEKLRAKHIAMLPPPFPNPTDTYLYNTETSPSETISTGSIPHQPGRYTTIRICDHESTMPTTVSLGLPSDAVVERATTAEAAVDAREEAQKEGDRINLLQAERDRAVQECMEKAKVRHQVALEQARLDRESKELMNDLKQLKMKDALRRQNHIEYTWDDKSNGKKACQEIFGPPGLKFQESDLFSTVLKKSQEYEDLPSGVEDASDGFGPESQNTTKWMDVSRSEEERKPRDERALNRLLKQIEAQRQHKKNGSGSSASSSETGNFRTEFGLKEDSNKGSESLQNDTTPPGEQVRNGTGSSASSSETGNFRTEFNLKGDSNEGSESSQNDTTPPGEQVRNGSGSSASSSETGNFRTEFNLQEDSDEVTQSSQNDSTPPGEQAREFMQEIMHPAKDFTDKHKHTTFLKGVIPTPDLFQEPVPMHVQANSPTESRKYLEEDVPELSPGKSYTQAKDPLRSESLLEKSLGNMRNDEALLKSVKDFQDRLLQQHKSCAKIQEQIQRLERKKATIDSMVADVTKPKC